jgi:hypothetical protein
LALATEAFDRDIRRSSKAFIVGKSLPKPGITRFARSKKVDRPTRSAVLSEAEKGSFKNLRSKSHGIVRLSRVVGEGVHENECLHPIRVLGCVIDRVGTDEVATNEHGLLALGGVEYCSEICVDHPFLIDVQEVPTRRC